MAKKFKRMFTGHNLGGNGKGDWKRDALVSDQQVAKNWCETFGHKRWDELSKRCLDCGKTAK